MHRLNITDTNNDDNAKDNAGKIPTSLLWGYGRVYNIRPIFQIFQLLSLISITFVTSTNFYNA